MCALCLKLSRRSQCNEEEGQGISEAALVSLRNRIRRGRYGHKYERERQNVVLSSGDDSKTRKEEKRYTRSQKEVTSRVTRLQFSEVEGIDGHNHVFLCVCVCLVCHDCKMARTLGQALGDLGSHLGLSF